MEAPLITHRNGSSLLVDYLKEELEPDFVQHLTLDPVVSLFLKTMAVVGGYSGSAIFVKTALQFPNELVAYCSAVGCFLGFGSFFTEGLIEIIKRIESPVVENEQKIRRKSQTKMMMGAITCAAVVFGLLSQFGLLQAAKDNFSTAAGVIGWISIPLTSGPLITSLLDGFNSLNQSRSDLWNGYTNGDAYRQCLEIKRLMIRNFKDNTRFDRPLSLDEKERIITCVNDSSRQALAINAARTSDFTNEIFVSQKPAKPLTKGRVGIIATECTLQAITIACALSFLYEQTLLSVGSAQGVTSFDPLIWFLVIASVSPWVWKAFTTPGTVVIDMFNQMLRGIGQGERKTLVEELHPKLSYGLDALALGGTSFAAVQIFTLASECCYDPHTAKGEIAIVCSMTTIMSFFYWALKRLLENGVIYWDSRNASQDLKNLIGWSQKKENILRVLNALSLEDVQVYIDERGYERESFLAALKEYSFLSDAPITVS